MKGYVVQRNDGTFMTPIWNPRSFTNQLAKADVFPTEVDALESITVRMLVRQNEAHVVALDQLVEERKKS